MSFTITTDIERAVELLVGKAGYEPEQLTPLPTWLERGDDILVFSLLDLGAIGSDQFPLYWAMPWERDRETPRQAPDTDQCGLGWRYGPVLRVTTDEVPA
jgi:hypothetical protein